MGEARKRKLRQQNMVEEPPSVGMVERLREGGITNIDQCFSEHTLFLFSKIEAGSFFEKEDDRMKKIRMKKIRKKGP